jgi:hypothetical protein
MNAKLCNWLILLVIILLIVIAYHIYLITNAVVREDFATYDGVEYDEFPGQDTPGDDIGGCNVYTTSYDRSARAINRNMANLKKFALSRASAMSNVNAVNIFMVTGVDNKRRTYFRYMYCLKNTKKTPTKLSYPNISGFTLFMKKKDVLEFQGVYPSGNKLPNTVYMNLLVRGRAKIYKQTNGKNTLIANVRNRLFNKRLTNFLPTDKLYIELWNTNSGKNYIIGNWFYNGKEYQTNTKTVVGAGRYSVGKRVGYYADVGNSSVLTSSVKSTVKNIEDCLNRTPSFKYHGFNRGKCVYGNNELKSKPVTSGIKYTIKSGGQFRGAIDNNNTNYTEVYMNEIPNVREDVATASEVSNHFSNFAVSNVDMAKAKSINVEIGADSSVLNKLNSINSFIISMPEEEGVSINPIEFCPDANYNLFDGYGCVDATSEQTCSASVIPPYKANKALCNNKWENVLYVKPSTSTDIQQIDDTIINRIIESMKLVYSRSSSQSGSWSCVPSQGSILSVRYNAKGNAECAASRTNGALSCTKNNACPTNVNATTVIECSDYKNGTWCNQALTGLKSTQRYDNTLKKLILDTWSQGYELLKFKPDEAAAVPYKTYSSFEQAMADSSFITNFILLIKRVNGICETSGKAQTGCQTVFRNNMLQLAKLTNLIKVNK